MDIPPSFSYKFHTAKPAAGKFFLKRALCHIINVMFPLKDIHDLQKDIGSIVLKVGFQSPEGFGP